MNNLEWEMIDILKKLKDKYGVTGVKAEFEAEGSRMEEMMRLKDVADKADLPITLKIGGAEAVTDIYNGIILGVDGLVAPMVETPYAVSKFLDVVKDYIQPDNRKNIKFTINIETITAVNNMKDILLLDNMDLLDSITFGRSDFVQSLGKKKSETDSDNTFEYVFKTAKLVKERGLKFTLGGNITHHSISFLNKLYKDRLIDKFETRKIVFDALAIEKHPKAGINMALEFELLWLKSKRRFYSKIKFEDEKRIENLEKRLS